MNDVAGVDGFDLDSLRLEYFCVFSAANFTFLQRLTLIDTRYYDWC